MDNKLHDEPLIATAEEGQVLVDGRDGVAVSLTPDAAAETSHRLRKAAVKAQGQMLIKAQAEKERAARRSR
ncbi:hypothetical protein [Sphingomonas sp. M1A8_2b]